MGLAGRGSQPGRPSVPVIRKLEPHNLGDGEGVLQREPLVCFVGACLQQSAPYDSLVVLVHGIRRRLPPVLVDAVFELDDGEVADLEREGLVDEDRLLPSARGQMRDRCRGGDFGPHL